MQTTKDSPLVQTLDVLANLADYSFINTLNCDPEAKGSNVDHDPREVFTGHFVPVSPTAIKDPKYVMHSKVFFKELGLADELASTDDFMRMFSGDTSTLPQALQNKSWACGYALSIYGKEYYQQCPFQTGNAYGDGRAVSIFEGIFNHQRWEMQLKGGGRTPYCRGADGRAVLRSSIREFLAQEHMYALGIPTSRSLSLFTSTSETVKRPWFNQGSYSKDPEVMIEEAVAISTRVAPSFIRLGQLELFGRRARKKEHPKAMQELEQIVLHLIDREYSDLIDQSLRREEKLLLLANAFCTRLTTLVAQWIRVGYCQGNFNSDNCAAGGFTLDYGPFGFCDMYDPKYQPWTGGGVHYSFMNQTQAAERNFHMFCIAIHPLLLSDNDSLHKLDEIRQNFSQVMQEEMQKMWASKLGLNIFDRSLFEELETLMLQTSVDFTIFFRELSKIPEDINPLKESFYKNISQDEKLLHAWSQWLVKWKSLIKLSSPESRDKLSKQMKSINPKYTLREWFLVPAYEQAALGDYTLIKQLQEIMTDPYAEQSQEIEEKFYRKKPSEFFEIAGISHVSCSS